MTNYQTFTCADKKCRLVETSSEAVGSIHLNPPHPPLQWLLKNVKTHNTSLEQWFPNLFGTKPKNIILCLLIHTNWQRNNIHFHKSTSLLSKHCHFCSVYTLHWFNLFASNNFFLLHDLILASSIFAVTFKQKRRHIIINCSKQHFTSIFIKSHIFSLC